MKIYKETRELKEQDLFFQLEGLTAKECYNKYKVGRDTAITQTFKFNNGNELDIKCVTGLTEDDTTWYEGVLFNPKGGEICHTEVEETGLGEWYLEDTENNVYNIEILQK